MPRRDPYDIIFLLHRAQTTNPEQLFAAGYSACFNGALSLALKLERVRAESTVSVTVTLREGETYEYFISAIIEGHIEGLSKEETERFLQKAHARLHPGRVCRAGILGNF